jgi:hypothetical protein
MDRLTRLLRAASSLAAVTMLAAGPLAAPASDDSSGSGLEAWARLRLEGRKYLIASGRSEISRGSDPRAEDLELLTVSSEARVLGAKAGRHEAASVMGGGRRGSLCWMELSPRKKARLGLVHESSGKITLTTFRPTGQSDEDSAGSWPVSHLDEWPLPRDELGGRTEVLDPYGLLGRLDALLESRSGELTVLTKRGPAQLRFERLSRERVRVRLRNLDDGAQIDEMIDAVVVDLTPGGEQSGETLLNMRGATRLWIDPASGALLRIEGEHEGAGGRLTLRLTAAAFLPGTRARPDWPGPGSAEACERAIRQALTLDGSRTDP